MFNQKRIFKITIIYTIYKIQNYTMYKISNIQKLKKARGRNIDICNFEDSFLVKHTRIRSIQMIYSRDSTDRPNLIKYRTIASADMPLAASSLLYRGCPD